MKKFIYLRVYEKEDNTLITYTGITNDMKRRQQQHAKGNVTTTNRYNKTYSLKEIRYNSIIDLKTEQKFKLYSLSTKLSFSKNWSRWSE